MTTDRIDRRLPEILTELSTPQVPDYLDDILRQTARTRRRPGWSFPERWLPMEIVVQPVMGRRIPWRTLGVLAILVLALAAAAFFIGSRTHHPAPLFGPAANGAIVYDRDTDIFMADASGSRERLLIGGETHDYSVRWSRDGTTIYFARDLKEGTAVMAADADGRNIRQLSPTLLSSPELAEVSPDGSRLVAINGGSGGVKTLSVLGLNGEGRIGTLNIGPVQPTNYADWRPPNGDEILFLGNPNGVTTDLALYVVRPDGTGLRQLAVQHDESIARPFTQVSFQDLALSDDGRMAAYWNWETKVAEGRSCFVHLLDLDTGRDRRMTFDPAASCEAGAAFVAPDRILVEHSDSDSAGSRLLIAPIDASAPGTFIGPTYYYQNRLGWALSPDRSKVLLVRDDEPSQLVTIATGAVENIGAALPGVGSWQRLAP
jgi:hypothetical protein